MSKGSKLKSALVIREAMNETIAKTQRLIETKDVTGDGAMDASGRAKNSLTYRRTGTRYELLSDMPGRKTNYIRTLEHGRKPGARPPVSAIKEWIEVKGITPQKGSKDSLAWAIATKIGQSGTKIHRQGGNSGILSFMYEEEYFKKTFTEPLRNALIGKLEKQMKDM